MLWEWEECVTECVWAIAPKILFQFTSIRSMFALVFTSVKPLTKLSRHFGNRVSAMRSAQVEENISFVATVSACTDNHHENEFHSLGKCRYTAKFTGTASINRYSLMVGLIKIMIKQNEKINRFKSHLMAHSAHISCILFHLYRTLSNRRRQRAVRDNREVKQKAKSEKIRQKTSQDCRWFHSRYAMPKCLQFYEIQKCVYRKDVRQNTHNSQRVQQQLLSASWIAQATAMCSSTFFSLCAVILISMEMKTIHRERNKKQQIINWNKTCCCSLFNALTVAHASWDLSYTTHTIRSLPENTIFNFSIEINAECEASGSSSSSPHQRLSIGSEKKMERAIKWLCTYCLLAANAAAARLFLDAELDQLQRNKQRLIHFLFCIEIYALLNFS